MEPKEKKKLISKVNRYIRKGRLDKAIGRLNQEIAEAPQDGELHHLLGIVYRNDGQYQKAESEYRTAEEYLPDDSNLKWEIAEFLVGLDRPEEGLEYAEFCVNEWPSQSQAHAILGKAYLQLKRFDEAESSLSEAIRLGEWNPDARYWLMDVYEETDRSEMIMTSLESYLSDSPNLASSHVFMAEYLHYEKGDCVAAFPYYEDGLIIAQSGKNSSWYKKFFTTTNYPLEIVDSYTRALVECNLFDAAEAVARENYKKVDLLAWRASSLRRKGDLDGALTTITKALGDKPGSPHLHYQYGSFLLELGNFIEAEKEFRYVVDQTGNQDTIDSWYLGALVVSLLNQDKDVEAKLLSDEGQKQNAERLQFSVLSHHHCARDWESTIQAKKNDLEDSRYLDTTLTYMAEAYTHLGEFEKAIDMYQRILEFQPRNGRIWLTLGEVYAQDGDTKKAIEALRHALDEKMLSRVEEKEAEKRLAELNIMH